MSAAPHQPPSVAARLRQGETVVTAWCGLGLPLVAELVAREGFDTVTLDQQHGLYDMGGTSAGLTALRLAGASALVRIPVGGFAVASRALDMGAQGIIAPMINSAADARTFVDFVKFPPVGERSWGPARVVTLTGQSLPDYLKSANAGTAAIAMIETQAALDALDAIAATPGLDALLVGPADMSIALSNGALVDPLHESVDRAADRVLKAAEKAGLAAGVFCGSAERAVELRKRGFRFLPVSTDTTMLRAGVQAALKVLKT
jgi:4-hydroxy-2-oxoheptanedioate aldolase